MNTVSLSAKLHHILDELEKITSAMEDLERQKETVANQDFLTR